MAAFCPHCGAPLRRPDARFCMSCGGALLRKGAGTTQLILNDFSLSIHPREFVALVDGSGAGKSTLMTFAGLFSFMPFNLPGILYLAILVGLAALGIYVQAQMMSKTRAIVVAPAAPYQPLPSSAPGAQAASSSVCPQCGAPIRPGAKFCNRCGATLSADSAAD